MLAAARNPHVLQGFWEKSNVLDKGLDMGVYAFSGTRTQTCRLPMRPFPACPLRAVLSLKRSIFCGLSPRTAFFSNQSRTPNSPGPFYLSDLRRVFRLLETCQPFCGKSAFQDGGFTGISSLSRAENLSLGAVAVCRHSAGNGFLRRRGGGYFAEFAKNGNGSAAGRRFSLHAPVGARRSRAPKTGRILQGASYCPMSLERASE